MTKKTTHEEYENDNYLMN